MALCTSKPIIGKDAARMVWSTFFPRLTVWARNLKKGASLKLLVLEYIRAKAKSIVKFIFGFDWLSWFELFGFGLTCQVCGL